MSQSFPSEAQQTAGHRRRAMWIAALVHRLSGIALACFLPLHFLALGLAIHGEAGLDAFLAWTEKPIVKLAEGGLVFLLTIHLLGGLRLLYVETVSWRPVQRLLAAGAAAIAAALAVAFIVRVA
jgi:fumarate reductase subunit D